MCRWCQSPTTDDFCSVECKEKFKNLLEKRIDFLQHKLSKEGLSSENLKRLQEYATYHAILMNKEL